jgi:hypothetical protein
VVRQRILVARHQCRAHTKLVHPESEQQRHQRDVTRHFAAYTDPDLLRVAGVDTVAFPVFVAAGVLLVVLQLLTPGKASIAESYAGLMDVLKAAA